MGEKFEKAVQDFVDRVASFPEGASRSKLRLVDRPQDLVRQTARKRGLVVFEDRGNGHRWHVEEGARD